MRTVKETFWQTRAKDGDAKLEGLKKIASCTCMQLAFIFLKEVRQ